MIVSACWASRQDEQDKVPIVLKRMPCSPASVTPAFTCAARSKRCMLQGLPSHHTLAIPICACMSYAGVDWKTIKNAGKSERERVERMIQWKVRFSLQSRDVPHHSVQKQIRSRNYLMHVLGSHSRGEQHGL
jgi:hypothetical protein